jgi:phospholipase C
MSMPELKHIVVLMLENRSFDHMVGYMQSATYAIAGIDAANPPTNPISPQGADAGADDSRCAGYPAVRRRSFV